MCVCVCVSRWPCSSARRVARMGRSRPRRRTDWRRTYASDGNGIRVRLALPTSESFGDLILFGKCRGTLFNAGDQTAKDRLLTWVDGVKSGWLPGIEPATSRSESAALSTAPWKLVRAYDFGVQFSFNAPMARELFFQHQLLRGIIQEMKLCFLCHRLFLIRHVQEFRSNRCKTTPIWSKNDTF